MLFNDLPEGYPEGYHLGFSSYIWAVYIFLTMSYGVYIFLLRRKTHSINKKELFLGMGLFFFCYGPCFILIQLGVYYPTLFNLTMNLSFSVGIFGIITLLYFYEKNIINWKYVPTLLAIISFSISVIVVIISIFYVYINQILLDYWLIYLISIYVMLCGIALLMTIIIQFQFTRRVSGNLRKKALIQHLGQYFFLIASLTDHPPVLLIFPKIAIYLSPITFIIGSTLIFYGVLGTIDGLTSYYNQAHICTVHRGTISKGDTIYYCPSCTTPYCQNCYEQVIMHEYCWNCGASGKKKPDIEFKKQILHERVIVDNDIKKKLKEPKVLKKK